jgi:putative endonuclease
MPYFIYVLFSRKFNRLYKGQTQDIQIRLQQHNAGEIKSTKPYRPWEIIYFEEFKFREEDVNREHYFKRAAGRRFLKSKLQHGFQK